MSQRAGDLGYSLDLLLVTYDDEDGNTVKVFSKGITIWKKDGRWKMAVDIWNVDPTITSVFQE